MKRMIFSVLVHNLRCSLLRIENRLLQITGLDAQLAPSLALNGPSLLPRIDQDSQHDEEQTTSLLDSILWMAAPKKRRTIEVNRTRRRDERKFDKVKYNIEPCPECGHLKQNYILCGFCYAKVCRETALIRQQIKEMESGPLRAPTVETVVLYEGKRQASRTERRG